ncbi:MAG: radical SAM protein [candidate division NC10 bacterium]|nr:radical SAM protein [candidate division NC10 bacterium]
MVIGSGVDTLFFFPQRMFPSMKVRLIYPKDGDFPLRYRSRIAPLGLISVASLFPGDWEVGYTDERLEPIDFEEKVDLVAISAMTYQASRAYAIADLFRSRGTRVILGGPHPSVLPLEAGNHADAVVVGEAEGIFPELLADLEKGRLQPIYRCAEKIELSNLPLPRRDLLQGKGYLPVDMIQAARGCPVNCEFCSVSSTFGRGYRMRPLPEILAEVQGLGVYLFFVDDNLLIKRSYTVKLLECFLPLQKRWVCLSSLRVADDPDLLHLMARSGCWLMYVDMGPWLSANLSERGMGLHQKERCFENLQRIHDAGIEVIGSFAFGFDHDDPGVFERTVRFCQRAKLDEVEFLILTPYPKTRLFERLEEEGRIIERDWAKYNTMNVVFQPKSMSAEQLLEGYRMAWREFYSQGRPGPASRIREFTLQPQI